MQLATQENARPVLDDPEDPFLSFQKYFSIRQALTTVDKEVTYRIRYNTYCEEFGFEPAECFPNRMESDEFEDSSVHCLITHIGSGLGAACVRIIPASIHGKWHALPYEVHCGESLDREALANKDFPRDSTCEASRFAVDGAFRHRSGERATRFGNPAIMGLSDGELRSFPVLSLALVLAAAAEAELVGRPNMFAVMEPFLPRSFARIGVNFRRVGRDVHHHGVRAVYVVDVGEFVDTMNSRIREFYDWVRAQFRDGVPSQHFGLRPFIPHGDAIVF